MMKRRTVLKSFAAAPVTQLFQGKTKASEVEDDPVTTVSKHYFASLRRKEKRRETVVRCADELCESCEEIPEETIDEIVESGNSTNDTLRRARLGVRILTELGITDVIDEGMIESGARDVSDYTRYLPLIGSFNHLRKAACKVKKSNPDTIENFLYASTTFGIEVALWTAGAPYKMAWRGTRFISNRTFLRLAKNGCGSCVGLVMSEIHWALRSAVYGLDNAVTQDRVEFVSSELSRLQKWADRNGYKVDFSMNHERLSSIIEENTDEVGGGGFMGPLPSESEGLIEQYIPELNIDLELSKFIPDWV